MHLALSPGERWIAASRRAERRRAFASKQRLHWRYDATTEDEMDFRRVSGANYSKRCEPADLMGADWSGRLIC